MKSKSKSRASARTNVSPAMQGIVDALGTTESPSWRMALCAADAAATGVLVSSGAIAESDEFYRAVASVANWFGFEDREREFSESMEGLSDDICESVTEAANAMEAAKWRGAYALGLAVGLRLAGGAR